MNTTRLLLIAIGLCTLVACSDSDDDDDGSTDGGGGVVDDQSGMSSPDGLAVRAGIQSVPESIAQVQAAAAANEALLSLDPIEHAANAESVEATLRPTSVILFGNPTLGTPLMARNRLAGLDLPQKMLAYEDEAGVVQVAYNKVDWLSARHGLDGVETLPMIAGALENLATQAAGDESNDTDTDTDTDTDGVAVMAGEGIEMLVSNQDFETTYNALKDAIEAAEPLRLVAEIDHAGNASNRGLSLPPTRLIVFGNPNLGTPLMQSSQSIAIDLPQKMLVFEEEGVVTLAWNDPAYTAARHGITDQDDNITLIAGALANLAAGAAGDDGMGDE